MTDIIYTNKAEKMQSRIQLLNGRFTVSLKDLESGNVFTYAQSFSSWPVDPGKAVRQRNSKP